MQTQLSPLTKWLITITVMISAMIEIIDSTIVNVVLHDMAGSLGASTEEISWVITSYIVSSAIMMPLTGFLVERFGRKRLLIVNIIGFMFFSALCGLSTSLTEIVIFRIFQGIFGAVLVPMSQYILRDTFSKKEQVKAMSIWGIGIMAAPVLGPTLGGYIADSMSWRWIFYINIPICIIAIIMTVIFISETPRKKPPIDYTGLMLMIIAICSLQILLDRGNTDDWLSSNFIISLLMIAVIGSIVFVIRGVQKKDNIINLRLFTNRNYSISSILLLLYTSSLFGILTIQPLVMEGFMNYSPKLTGILMAPRGIASAIAMIFVTPLAKKIDLRIIIITGILLTAWGTYLFADIISLNADMWALTYPGIIQGFGMGLFFVPVSTIALRSLPDNSLAEGSGIFSFSRNLGTSIGVSLLITVLTRQAQVSWQELSGNITMMNPNYQTWLQHLGWQGNSSRTIANIGNIIYAQSSMVSFIDACYLAFWLLIISIPFVLLLKKPKKGAASSVH